MNVAVEDHVSFHDGLIVGYRRGNRFIASSQTGKQTYVGTIWEDYREAKAMLAPEHICTHTHRRPHKAIECAEEMEKVEA